MRSGATGFILLLYRRSCCLPHVLETLAWLGLAESLAERGGLGLVGGLGRHAQVGLLGHALHQRGDGHVAVTRFVDAARDLGCG